MHLFFMGRRAGVAAALLAAWGCAWSQGGATLSLPDALQAAQHRSAGLLAQQAAARAARELAVAAGRLPDPVLQLSVNNLPIENTQGHAFNIGAEPMTSRTVGLAQTFVGADKRSARSARFEREADAALAAHAAETTRLQTQTANAWLARHYQEQALALWQQQRQDAELLRDAAESAYRGGRSSQGEVLAAHAAIARIDTQLLSARSAVANARALLQRWVGEAAARPLGALPPLDRTPGADPAVAQNLDRRPDLLAVAAQVRLAQAEADVVRLDRRADWTWSMSYAHRGQAFGDMVSVGVAIPLQWQRERLQDRTLAARLARVEQWRQQHEELLRQRRFEWQSVQASWREGLDRLAVYGQRLIPLAGERVAAAEVAFRGGKGPLTGVLQARRELLDTRLERLRIEQQTALWWAELNFLIPTDAMPRSPQP